MKQTAMLAVAALRLALPASPGGADYARALNQIVVKPYTAATGQRVAVSTAPSAGWDLTQMKRDELDQACRAGTVAKIDWPKLGGRDRFLPLATSDCGVGAYLHGIVLTWDSAHGPGAPNWGDFWNVVRLPGKRGLHRGAAGTLEIALLADGVAPADLYATLGTPGGVDRAFHKLDQLRPYIVWWSGEAEPMAIVASGQALMSSAPSERVQAASRRLHRAFGLQWAGSLLRVESWTVAAATSRRAAAEALIAAATEPARQLAVAQAAGFSGATLQQAKPAPELAGAIPFDATFWRDRGPALEQRFSGWLKH